MAALFNPLFMARTQRGGLRQKSLSPVRTGGAHQVDGMLAVSSGTAPDCVFKRFPSIGDTPSRDKQRA